LQKKSVKIEEGIKAIQSLSASLSSFTSNGLFEEKEKTFYKLVKSDFEFEMDFLNQICAIEQELALKFAPSNWPRGYRLESCFIANVVFNVAKKDFDLYQDYYTIRIWEDIMAKKRHRVFFSFPEENREMDISSILDKLQKKTKLSEFDVNHELLLLQSLTNEDLKLIGNLYHKENAKLITNACNSTKRPLGPYLKLLEVKFDFSLLRIIKNANMSVAEGTICFEPLLGIYPVFREVGKYVLQIRILNNDVSHIYFVYLNYVFSLLDILKYAGVDALSNDNEFEHLITFSDCDLNIIAFLIKEMVKS
jgi:hypothetical protein